MFQKSPPYLDHLVDLHLHLGSSSTPHFLWELAHEQGIRLPQKEYWSFINSITVKEQTTYDNYLHLFDLTELIQSSTYAIERATHKAVSRAFRKGNIETLEIRFNPMLRNNGGEQDLDKIIYGAVVGMKHACLEYPVQAGIILMMDRRFSKEQNKIIVAKAARFAAEGVVGIDVAGPITSSFHVSDIRDAIETARASGLGITIHTGEVTPAAEIWDVVNILKPDRIGHGIRSVDYPKLLEYLCNNDIVLELCPTSNLQTGAVINWEDMKIIIKTLKKSGVQFTINSDGPELLGTNVKEEFERLLEREILSVDDVITCTDVAKKATFIK